MQLATIINASEEPVSHNPAAKKRVWFRKGELPPFTQIARVIVPPGEVLAVHAHADMHELFIVLEGSARMVVDGIPNHLSHGDAIALASGESHELSNPSDRALVFLVAGWTDHTVSQQ